jgi:hypothetical protein
MFAPKRGFAANLGSVNESQRKLIENNKINRTKATYLKIYH